MKTVAWRPVLAHATGYAAMALIVIGVWGLWGWQWAAIAAGLPPAAFYLWGQIRSARVPITGEVE